MVSLLIVPLDCFLPLIRTSSSNVNIQNSLKPVDEVLWNSANKLQDMFKQLVNENDLTEEKILITFIGDEILISMPKKLYSPELLEDIKSSFESPGLRAVFHDYNLADQSYPEAIKELDDNLIEAKRGEVAEAG